MGSKFFEGLNQKSGSISISGIQSSNSCKKNHGKILIVAEVIRRLVTDSLEKTRIEIWPFMWLFGGLMVIFNPIDFLLGFPINLNVNTWQNNFEVDISKNVAKIANLRPKIGQIPLLSLDNNWHNSIIFHPILNFLILICLFLKVESNGFQIKAISLLVNILVFGPIFAPRLHMGKIVRMDPKPT